ncbi:MAG TPA: deoxyribose-phosphate aldolase [Bacteroidaceae bacterium]|nr:deoxyribose-phosphate aldolase [Bacteroidaceae bacterium]
MEESRLDKYNKALSNFNANFDNISVEKDLKNIQNSFSANSQQKIYKKILNLIDLTSLNITDNDEKILALTEKINDFNNIFQDLENVAAICVYPKYTSLVKESLESENIKVACVSGNFPSSQTFLEIKIAETSLAIRDGAEEIDIVMNLGMFLNGDYEGLCDEIEEIKSVCKEKTLKVILETGSLESYSDIYKASILAMYSGADFIKTSTGKEKKGATPESVYIMCLAIKDYYKSCGRMVGIKPSGGIDTVNDAVIYYTIVESVLKEKWLNNRYFRIGASRLANQLLAAITGRETFYF